MAKRADVETSGKVALELKGNQVILTYTLADDYAAMLMHDGIAKGIREGRGAVLDMTPPTKGPGT